MKPLDLSSNADWRQRFRAASIAWATVAAAQPTRGLVCTNQDGIFQLYAWETISGALTRLTDEPAGVVNGLLSPDGQWVYFMRDAGGNEIGHFVRVPFNGGIPEDITPDMPPYSAFVIHQSRSGNILGFMAAGKDGFVTHLLRAGEGPKSIYQSQRLSNGPIFSQDGDIAIIASTERSGTTDYALLAFDTRTGQRLGELWDGAGTSVEPALFSPLAGDARLLATTSRSGYERPLLWNPVTGERRDLVLGDMAGTVSAWDWSPDATRVLLCQLHQAQYRLFVYDLNTDSLTRLEHPEGVLGGFFPGFFTAEGQIWITWQDPAHPPHLVELDSQTGALKRTVLSAGEPPSGRGFRSIEFKSENGALIQGWLATPGGDGPFATILHTHGGPTSVQTAMFAPSAQAWLDHGFAFCTINYHGSVTFGKAFEKSILGNLGDLEVQDMAAAYQWLVDNHIARPDSVLLTGGSYGGYLTLQAIGRRPELWAGGMAIVAIADWKTMYEDEAEQLRGYQRALFGGAPDETPEATRASSPITYAEQIRAPLFVIQGANDTRCPARQMRVYEEKLKSLGKAIHVHWFDAGHGSRAQEQQIEQMELMLRFAYQVLG